MSLFDWIRRTVNGRTEEIRCSELMELAEDVAIRKLCLDTCINLIANSIGRCEFRTYVANEEVFGDEYYLWNFEPNANQNSTEFLHKLIAKMIADNEALVITTKARGKEYLVIADSFQTGTEYPAKMNEYTGVAVGGMTYDKTFRENEVLHFKLEHINAQEAIRALYSSYVKLISAAKQFYTRTHGTKLKVHVDQVADGGEFEEKFQTLLKNQIKPFVQSDSAILPEFDGYTYTAFQPEGSSGGDSRDIRNLIEDVFDLTARPLLIPAVLVNGKVEATADANKRLLSQVIDPICDQLSEEITRKRYGIDEWKKGNFLRVDSSSILHFDLFENAASVEKLVGSGAYTINDVLRAAGVPPIGEKWANEHYLTLNIGQLSEQTKNLSSGGDNT